MKGLPRFFKNLLITVAVLSISFLISLQLQWAFHIEEHITTLFVFAVFLISLLTGRYGWGMASAFAGMFLVNYAFTFPYFRLNFVLPGNTLSAVVMITIALLTGMLTTKVRQNEIIRAESERERMRANLLRAVSHDLRTPLTTIYGSSSALLEEREKLTREQQAEMLRGIREDADWLVQMVENLLSITRIDSGQVKLNKTPTVLEELIDSVLVKFRSRCPGQGVELDLPEEMVLIPMDAMLIQQVLLNLLDNAVRHARGMTRLCLSVSLLGDCAVFQVADDGCGIPADRMETIFRGYSSRETAADGNKRSAGIGLSVCDTIIKAHGSTIQAENRKTGGAAFRFILPLEEEAYVQSR